MAKQRKPLSVTTTAFNHNYSERETTVWPDNSQTVRVRHRDLVVGPWGPWQEQD